MSKTSHKIYFIEVLRGPAALLVVAYHITGILMGAYSFWPGMGRDLFRNGNIGVDIFFMISGFIICYATRNKEDNYRSSFIIRRFFRIYPLFIICLTIAWLTYNSGYDYLDYLHSATLMQNNYAGKAPFFGYNILYPAWTIAYEVMFYFVFYFGMCINHKYRGFITAILLLMAMSTIQISFKGELSVHGHFSSYSPDMGVFSPPLTLLGSPLMLEFIIGMGCYYLYNTLKTSKNITVSLLFLTLSVIAISMMYFVDLNSHGITEKGIVAAAIFIPLMLSEMTGMKLKSKVSRFFSDISYSLYLTHAMVLKYYTIYLKDIGINDFPKGVLSFFSILAVCIVVAYIVHITVEKWFINIGKKIITILSTKENNNSLEKKPT
ncbi:acyltransferase family protein [Enterobacter sp. C4G1]|uniref:acyltransferase family protein n=1 Tax=Enterobacter sp. C4G1 TaxID=3458724 RepID=UPI0040683E37